MVYYKAMVFCSKCCESFEHHQIFLTMNLIIATSYFGPEPDLMPMMLLWCICFVVEESKRTHLCCFLFLSSEGVTPARFVCITSARFACVTLARFFLCFVSKVLHFFHDFPSFLSWQFYILECNFSLTIGANAVFTIFCFSVWFFRGNA